MSQDTTLYARGFCIMPEGRGDPPSRFRSTFIEGWRVSVEPRSQLASAASGDGRFVVLIGYVLDIANGHDDGARIAQSLLAALSDSERSFFASLDYLGGRYAVFYGDRAGASILGDACATRTIYYSRSEPFISSHYEILAKECGTGRSDHWNVRRTDRNRHTTYGYPAGTTPDRNVGLLMGNMVLRIKSMTYERYYPRRELPNLSVEDAATAIREHFETQLKVLAGRYRIVCSLTAGLDSRCTLAALRPFLDRSKFFTYATQENHEADARIAALLAKRHGLEHELMPRQDTESDVFQKFKAVLARNNYHPHNREAAYGYLSLFRPGDIHIRSTMYEVARAFYRVSRKRPEELDAEGMAALYYRHFGESDRDLVFAFSEYIAQSNFGQQFWNHDPYDLFYVEQRMSCWHALVLLEADPSVDTYMLMNARCCLEAGQAVPQENKIDASVLKAIISDMWPELLELPVNPKRLDSIPES